MTCVLVTIMDSEANLRHFITSKRKVWVLTWARFLIWIQCISCMTFADVTVIIAYTNLQAIISEGTNYNRTCSCAATTPLPIQKYAGCHVQTWKQPTPLTTEPFVLLMTLNQFICSDRSKQPTSEMNNNLLTKPRFLCEHVFCSAFWTYTTWHLQMCESSLLTQICRQSCPWANVFDLVERRSYLT